VEELKFLMKDHYKPEAPGNCKHCLIKFKKSTNITNLFIGDFFQFLPKDKFTEFELLHHFMIHLGFNFATIDNIGVLVRVQASKNLIIDESRINYIEMRMPAVIVTSDTGYFKNNLTVHVSNTVDEIRQPIAKPARNHIRMRSSVSHRHRKTFIMDSQGVTPIILTSDMTVEKNFLQHLDGTHFIYCRNLEKRIRKLLDENSLWTDDFDEIPDEKGSEDHSINFNEDSNIVDMDEELEIQDNQPIKMHLLFYRRNTQFKDLLELFDKSAKDHHLRNLTFLRVKDFGVQFRDPVIGVTMLTVNFFFIICVYFIFFDKRMIFIFESL
jgi:hypothetical protein